MAENSKPVPPPPPAFISNSTPAFSDRFEQVIQKISPAVVSIEAVKPPAPSPNGRQSGKPIEESGSGVIVRVEGIQGAIIVTNNHVVSNAKADQITVHLADNRLFHPVQIWADPESDIAALRIDVEDLPYAPFGDSERARVGQWVLAFGSPFGLNQTVTHGIISARARPS